MNLHQTAVEREFGTQVTVKINGGDVTVDEGDTILTGLHPGWHRHADHLLRREPHSGQRVSRLCR